MEGEGLSEVDGGSGVSTLAGRMGSEGGEGVLNFHTLKPVRAAIRMPAVTKTATRRFVLSKEDVLT